MAMFDLAYNTAKTLMPNSMILSAIYYKLGIAQLELDLKHEAK